MTSNCVFVTFPYGVLGQVCRFLMFAFFLSSFVYLLTMLFSLNIAYLCNIFVSQQRNLFTNISSSHNFGFCHTKLHHQPSKFGLIMKRYPLHTTRQMIMISLGQLHDKTNFKRASRTARAKRVSSNGTHDHTFRSLETFCQFPSDFFVSKSLISVRVSMLHFIFKRLSSQENVIWNCSAINVLSY